MKSLKYITLAVAAAAMPLAAQAQNTNCTEARLMWADVKESGSVSVLQAFVSTFPDCPIYKGLAEEKLANLAAPASGGISESETDVAQDKEPLRADEEIADFENTGRDYNSFTEVEASCMAEAAAPTQHVSFRGVNFSDIDVKKAFYTCAKIVKQDDTHPEAMAAFARVLSKMKRYDLALQQARLAAERGSALAMNIIAYSYNNGNGVDQDLEKAIEWYQKGHNAGFPMATYNLASFYAKGEGVDVDTDKALGLYNQAANFHYPQAHRKLGQIYREGEWVERNMELAMDRFSLAASMGDAAAAGFMGYIFEEGEHGYRQDDKAAFHAYQTSVDLGNIDWVQHNLASMYYDGRGTDKDLGEAEHYWHLAAEQGHAKSQRKYARILDDQGYPHVAFEWYLKAAEQGDNEAQKRIDELTNSD